MSDNHFYIFMGSHGDVQQVFPDNKPNNFTIPLGDAIELDHDWEVGLAELTIPNSFLNVDASMNKIIVGNHQCEYRFQIPIGQYTPQSFCETVNTILSKRYLRYKLPLTDLQGNVIDDPMRAREKAEGLDQSFYEPIDMEQLENQDEILSTKDWWEQRDIVERYWSQSYEFSEHYNYSVVERNTQYAKQGVQAWLTPPQRVQTEAETRFRLGRIRQGLPHLTESRSYYQHAWDAFQSYCTSYIRLSYDEKKKKISISYIEGGVRDEYISFPNDKLPTLLGLGFSQTEHLAEPSFQNEDQTKTVTGEFMCDFEKFSRHIYIYTDLVKHSRIANQNAPILKYITLPQRAKEDDHDILCFSYQKPQYYSLAAPTFNTVSIALKDEWGDEIKFHNAQETVMVMLHFRKKRKI